MRRHAALGPHHAAYAGRKVINRGGQKCSPLHLKGITPCITTIINHFPIASLSHCSMKWPPHATEIFIAVYDEPGTRIRQASPSPRQRVGGGQCIIECLLQPPYSMAWSSEEARLSVFGILAGDDSFCGQGGRVWKPTV